MHRMFAGSLAALAVVCAASTALAAKNDLRLTLESGDDRVFFKQGIIGPEIPAGIIGPEISRFNTSVSIVLDALPDQELRFGYFVIAPAPQAGAVGLLTALGLSLGYDATTLGYIFVKYGIIGPEQPAPIELRQSRLPQPLSADQASRLALTFYAALVQDGATADGKVALAAYVQGLSALGVGVAACGIIGPE